MSAARFAPITSALLARKGEARPWGHSDAVAEASLRAAPLSSRPPPLIEPSVLPPGAPVSHRCTIRMSAHDFQRLGIAAVKGGTTRQHLLQQALADLLAAKEQEYRAGCRCMAPAPCTACDPV